MITFTEGLILAVISCLLGMFLFGCGHEINNGKIVGKFFNKASVSTTIMPVTCGKTIIMMPVTTRKKDQWSFKVKGKNDEGEIVVESFDVTKEVWDSYLYGQVIDFKEDG